MSNVQYRYKICVNGPFGSKVRDKFIGTVIAKDHAEAVEKANETFGVPKKACFYYTTERVSRVE